MSISHKSTLGISVRISEIEDTSQRAENEDGESGECRDIEGGQPVLHEL